MVNPGHPSRACKACKAAKTKCSEEQPTCRRCSKKGCPCVYAESTFRSMNTWSEVNVKTRVAAKLSVRSAQDENKATTRSVSPLETTISSDWINDAVQVFFREFVREPDHLQSTWGNFTSLPKAYERIDLPYISSAVEACAISYLATSSGNSELESTAAMAYSKTIKSFAPAIQNPKEAASDESLTCMMLLSLYETISGTKPAHELFHAHHRGQAAAVQLRMQSSRSEEAEVNSLLRVRGILGATNRQLIWRDLGNRSVPKLCATQWPEYSYRSWLDEATARIALQIAYVSGHAKDLQIELLSNDDQLDREKLAACVDEAVMVYATIEACFETAPSEWKPQLGSQAMATVFSESVSAEILSNLESRLVNFSLHMSTDPQLDEHFAREHGTTYKPRTDTYPSRAIMTLWNMIRGVKLHLIRAMIDLTSICDQVSPECIGSRLPTFNELKRQLSDTVHEVCGTIPYALGDVSGNEGVSGPSSDLPALLWALHKICCIPGLTPEVRAWIVLQFRRIGTERHIRQGLNLTKLYTQHQPCLATYTTLDTLAMANLRRKTCD